MPEADSRPALSPAELAVLRAYAAGAHVREIARDLGLREATALARLLAAQAKLGARHQGEMVAIALREGMLG